MMWMIGKKMHVLTELLGSIRHLNCSSAREVFFGSVNIVLKDTATKFYQLKTVNLILYTHHYNAIAKGPDKVRAIDFLACDIFKQKVVIDIKFISLVLLIFFV